MPGPACQCSGSGARGRRAPTVRQMGKSNPLYAAGRGKMADQLQQWIDKCAIQDLIFRYSDSVNRADWEETAKLYAADAVWESPLFNMRFESGAEWCNYLARSTESSELLIQTPHCPVVTLLTDETARATTTIHEFSRGTNVEDSSFG